MEHIFSREERLEALLAVQSRMVHGLYVHLLSEMDEPIENAKAFEDNMLAELEAVAVGAPDREAARIQQLYVEPVEGIWKSITAALVEMDQPIPYTPTAYGYRLGDQLRGKQSPPPPPSPDEEPDL